MRAALVNALNTAALELGPENMYFNAVAPGYIDTGRLDEWNRSQAKRTGMDYRDVEARALEKIPLSRFGKPHDVASVVGYLLSEENTYITGQHILADGGLVTQL